MEFVINLVFFILAPGIILHDAIKEIFSRCPKLNTSNKWQAGDKEKNVYSSNDMQVRILNKLLPLYAHLMYA